jgi:hypothetical protein
MELQLLHALLTVGAEVPRFTATRYVVTVHHYDSLQQLYCLKERGLPLYRAAHLSECHQVLVSCGAAN